MVPRLTHITFCKEFQSSHVTRSLMENSSEVGGGGGFVSPDPFRNILWLITVSRKKRKRVKSEEAMSNFFDRSSLQSYPVAV